MGAIPKFWRIVLLSLTIRAFTIKPHVVFGTQTTKLSGIDGRAKIRFPIIGYGSAGMRMPIIGSGSDGHFLFAPDQLMLAPEFDWRVVLTVAEREITCFQY